MRENTWQIPTGDVSRILNSANVSSLRVAYPPSHWAFTNRHIIDNKLGGLLVF